MLVTVLVRHSAGQSWALDQPAFTIAKVWTLTDL